MRSGRPVVRHPRTPYVELRRARSAGPAAGLGRTDTERTGAPSIGSTQISRSGQAWPRLLFTHTTSPRTLSLAASLGHLVKGWLVASNYPVSARLTRVAPRLDDRDEKDASLLDGQKSAINYLLRYFRIWLINEKMQHRLMDSKRARTKTANPKLISWIEKLLQTPLDDYRKFVVWRILSPYLINIRKYSADESYEVIKNWLDKCSQLRSLDFNPNYTIKYNINSARRSGYLPISLEKLKTENAYLYNLSSKS